MAITKQRKNELVTQYGEWANRSQAMIMVQYTGMSMKDMDALRAIRVLVHDRGMTLKGAKAILAEQGIEAVLGGTATLTAAAPEPVPSPARELQASVARAFGAQEDAADRKVRLEGALQELTGIKSRIDAARARRAA